MSLATMTAGPLRNENDTRACERPAERRMIIFGALAEPDISGREEERGRKRLSFGRARDGGAALRGNNKNAAESAESA